MIVNLFNKPVFLFKKKNKKFKIKKKNNWVLKVPDLVNNLAQIKTHNDKYKGKPIMHSILNRHLPLTNSVRNLILSRLQELKSINFNGTTSIQGKIISDLLINYWPYENSNKLFKLSNLFINDMLLTYKGWRHFKGLPVRGQRTWTNAANSKQSNTELKGLKFKIYKSYYKGFNNSAVSIGMSVESYNRLWYKQWLHEWLLNKAKRERFSRSSHKVCVYDFLSVAAGRISGYQRQAKPGKKKRVYKVNYFTIGIPRGSIKRLIGLALKKPPGATIKDRSSLAQVLMSVLREKRKVTKKISATKKKQDKLAKLKKKKDGLKNKSSELKRMRDQRTKNLKKSQK